MSDNLYGYKGYPSSRLRRIEQRERWKTGNGDPNGVVTAAISVYYWDYTNDKLYVNDDGATGWTLVGGAGSVTGTGTTPELAYWTAASAIGSATNIEFIAGGGLYFRAGGAAPSNAVIQVNDNVAEGLRVIDDDSAAGGSPEYCQIVTTDGVQQINFSVGPSSLWSMQHNATSPNYVGGYSGNLINPASTGSAVLSGGFITQINQIGSTGAPDFTVICGGRGNTANGDNMFLGGGRGNTIGRNGNFWNVLCGGIFNLCEGGDLQFLGGGRDNTITGAGGGAVLCGGQLNVITSSGYSVVSGGYTNTITSGGYSIIPGGELNDIDASYCFAAGRRAHTSTNTGVFIWADSTNADFTATTANQFAVRANGGLWFNATDLAAAPGVFDLVTLEGRITGAGVGANGDGLAMLFKFESATAGNYQNMGRLQYEWTNATDATRRAQLVGTAYDVANEREMFRAGPLNGGQYEFCINENGADVDFRVESDDDAYSFFLEGSDGHILMSAGNTGITTPAMQLHQEESVTLGGNIGDGYSASKTQGPVYSGAYTVTRHNYIQMQDASLDGGAAITDGAAIEFDAAAGTHIAVDAGTTKTSPGTVSAWMKININGTIYYVPAYTSKTT